MIRASSSGKLTRSARVSAKQLAPAWGSHLGIRVPAQVLGFERPVLDPEDLQQEPPRLGIGRVGGDGQAQAALGVRRAIQRQAGPRLTQVGRALRGTGGVQRPPGPQCAGPIAGAGGRLGLGP